MNEIEVRERRVRRGLKKLGLYLTSHIDLGYSWYLIVDDRNISVGGEHMSLEDCERFVES